MATTETTHDADGIETTENEPTLFSQTTAKRVLEQQGFTIEDHGEYVRIHDDGNEDISFACGAMWADGWRVYAARWNDEELWFKQADA